MTMCRGFDVQITWTYADNGKGPAECIARLGEREERWRGPGLYVTAHEREHIPMMLAQYLTRPLPPPSLGQVYYKALPGA